MPTTAPYISRQLDQVLKTMISRDASFDPLTFDPTTAVPANLASRFSALSAMIDDSTDIAAFVNRGGKLLLAHGLSDVLVSTRATADYYTRLVKQYGQPKVDSFARYYEIPGLGHAVSSQFNATWDSLAALEAWVEGGTAPTNQVTTDTVGVAGRTRPLCDYPKWPKYKGTGDVNAAASYACVAE
jgi:feruloyl esterase